MSMSFSNRIKKEMTEAIVRALLEDAGYRVIDSGIEKVLRELSCLSSIEYAKLGYPEVMSRLPDFTVMDREQTVKYLVEVKYRTEWSDSLFDEVKEQVRLFGEVVLVSVNAKAADPNNYKSPSRFIRCCALRFRGEAYEFQHKKKIGESYQTVWASVDEITNPESWLWWAMLPLHEKFPLMKEAENRETLLQAVKALAGILDS